MQQPRARDSGAARSRRPNAARIGRGWTIATYVGLIFFVLWTVVPFIWMLLASVKTNKEIYQDFTILPKSLYFGHYQPVRATGMGEPRLNHFSRWLRNTAYSRPVVTVLSIVLGALGGVRDYAAALRWPAVPGSRP